jgi:hemerythrin-like metal-binding protein
MAFMKWTYKFSTGVAVYDAEHKTLFSLINNLHDSMTGVGDARLSEILDGVVNYTIQHFDHEERVLALRNYPGLEDHKRQHELLKAKVQAFRDTLSSGNSQIYIALLRFIKQWLLKHIQKEDKAYSAFLNAKGVH